MLSKKFIKYWMIEGGILLIFLGSIIGVGYYGQYLHDKGEEQYNDYCIERGNEKFLSIDSGHIKCYRQDKIALYEDYKTNWNYSIGEMLIIIPVLFIIMFILVLGITILGSPNWRE